MMDPKDYDYLWTDYDVNFIFTSCYLSKEFRKADIILIYSHEDKALKFFLSKKDRKKFSDYGAEFYEKQFAEWKKDISAGIIRGRELISETEKDMGSISSMSSKDIRGRVSERAELFQSLSGKYFYTEFFFLDKAEKLAIKPGNESLKKNLEEMGRLKLEARDVLTTFYNHERIFRPYLDEAGKRAGRDDMQWLSFQEALDVLDGRKVDVPERGSMDWVLAKQSRWEIVTGEKAGKTISAFDEHFFSSRDSLIKGTVANKGHYSGKACVIRTFFSDRAEKEIERVAEGDVIVAETTGPEMIVACRRAGAIVTDEGGLTSHAAVVSRELGIPCIVGTKIATKVLKDGDLIEVDAEKGIVRRIKQ